VRRVFGPRSVVEAVFLVAVPVVALAIGYGRWAIIGASGVAYLLVLLLEAVLWRTQRAAKPAPAVARTVPVVTHEPPQPPEPTPEPEVVPEPEPEPEPVRALEPVPEPEPAAPEPAPAAASVVVPIGVGAGPREWNLWELERLVRDSSGGDSLVDEERSFLLMYLREFAGPDGSLPVDFDGLVRDSFGELVGARQ
jgi:hypothetical protein